MARSQHRSKRSASGGKYINARKKKQFELAREPTLTGLGEKRVKTVRKLGGSRKKLLLSNDVANVLDPKTKKATKSKILNIVENPANRNYVRRNIITKGTVIVTEKGKARVTSRPGQETTINAVLI
ncbi:MAG: 30S ribosomal protein S8e [Candidatus Nanoarchaeia archaeon]